MYHEKPKIELTQLPAYCLNAIIVMARKISLGITYQILVFFNRIWTRRGWASKEFSGRHRFSGPQIFCSLHFYQVCTGEILFRLMPFVVFFVPSTGLIFASYSEMQRGGLGLEIKYWELLIIISMMALFNSACLTEIFPSLPAFSSFHISFLLHVFK